MQPKAWALLEQDGLAGEVCLLFFAGSQSHNTMAQCILYHRILILCLLPKGINEIIEFVTSCIFQSFMMNLYLCLLLATHLWTAEGAEKK